MHQCAEGCRRARHSQWPSPNTDMDLELLASSQHTATALPLSAVVSLWKLFVMADRDSDEFSQEATTRGAV